MKEEYKGYIVLAALSLIAVALLFLTRTPQKIQKNITEGGQQIINSITEQLEGEGPFQDPYTVFDMFSDIFSGCATQPGGCPK
ncbi:MAG: hypothetical protein QHH09_00030 [Microgenomates group bacterium]|nr:hypothetical protein [Microgenomates group bacterium]